MNGLDPMNALEGAIALAATAHNGQLDKAGQPYILHPIWVMMKMRTDLERQVAVLHDVCEDGGLRVQGLRLSGFSEEVCAAVEALTRVKGESYDSYIERVCRNLTAARVKRWDLVHNMDTERLGRDLAAEDHRRQAKYLRAYDVVRDVVGEDE